MKMIERVHTDETPELRGKVKVIIDGKDVTDRVYWANAALQKAVLYAMNGDGEKHFDRDNGGIAMVKLDHVDVTIEIG